MCGANTVIGNQYTYNDASNITNWTNASGNHAYGYDAVDRLTSATNSAQPNENYTYDGVGNRNASHLSASYNYQPFNKLTSTAGVAYTYDNNGNLLSKTDSLGTTNFIWNEENQLTQVMLPNGLTVAYKYDGLGRRIQRTTSAGAHERYVYDGQNVLLDLNADWSVATTYLNGLGIDNHLRQTNSVTGISYFLTDHLRSTAGLMNATGNVLEQISYDSFGNSVGSVRTRYGYTGRELDADTRQLFYRARFFDPEIGRFISEDPIGLKGGISLYDYVRNNPLRYLDPKGTNPVLAAAAIVGGEAVLHYYLTIRADRFYPDDNGRKKHCYVNCMSSRIHGFNPFWPTVASVEQEALGLAHGLVTGTFKDTLDDSIGDFAADIHGQVASAIIWRWCKDLCAECPF